MVFDPLLKHKSMGFNDTVLTKHLFENNIVNCLRFEGDTRQPRNDNLCLFWAPALHLHGNDELEEETSNLFNFFHCNCVEGDPPKSQGVLVNDIPNVEDFLQLKNFLHHFVFVDWEIISELARRSIPKHDNNVNFLRYTNHIC